MESTKRKTPLMQLQATLPRKILVSAAIMLVLILAVNFFKIPNPNIILIVGLVLSSAMYGYGGGVTAAIIMFFYTLYFFSTDHSFVQYTSENLVKVIVSLIGIVADMVLVCKVKQDEVRAFREVDELTDKLREENEQLEAASMTDSLTRVRNRLALRHDYNSYQNREVTVMMVDLDNFKAINDTYGHDEGDRILRETANLLAKTFGVEHTYRYGGDEFLVVCPDLSEAAFREKLDALLAQQPAPDPQGGPVGRFSAGIVHKGLGENKQLRELFSVADEEMYAAKKRKKDA